MISIFSLLFLMPLALSLLGINHPSPAGPNFYQLPPSLPPDIYSEQSIPPEPLQNDGSDSNFEIQRAINPLQPPRPPQDIINRLPLGRFLEPSPNSELKENVTISFELEKADKVEFYLRIPSSLVPTYLGTASKEGEKWIYSWNTANTPNGYYFIMAKITSELGDYWGSKVQIKVDNPVIESKEDLQKMEEKIKEIKEKAAEFQEQKEKIAEKREEIIQETKEKIEKLQEKIAPESSPEAKEEVTQRITELKDEVEDILKKTASTPDIPPQERETIKEQTSKKIEKVKEEIGSIVKPPVKEEFYSETDELKNRILEAIVRAEKTAQEQKLIEEKEKAELSRDSDKDGIVDREEVRLGTNPFLADSDGDGFFDESEIRLGSDPLTSSPSQKIKYQDPREIKMPPSKEVVVEKIEVVRVEGKKEPALKISGKALPHTFVTIYIFSLPTIVIAKADANGRWEYILDKPLTDGQHTVFAAITNNEGQIEKKSESLEFVKQGDKLLRLFESQEQSSASALKSMQKSFIVLVIALVVFGLGAAFLIIGIVLMRKSSSLPSLEG